MFMNNQINIDELNFFQDFSQREMKMARNNSYELCFDNNDVFAQSKWNSAPAELYNYKFDLTPEVKKEQEDDNSSNVADTEENLHTLEQNEEQVVETPRKSENISKDLDTNEHSFDSVKFNERDVGELVDIISRPNTDMNALLSDVLTAGPTDPSVKRKRTVTQKVKGKRVRKTKKQIDILTKEYELNSEWSSEDILGLATSLGLTKKQVYKWYWDQKVAQGETKPRNW